MTRGWLAIALVQLMSIAVAEETLTVLTYNIHHAEGTDGVLDLERIAEIVRAQGADVVCLQEVDKNLPRTNLEDMPARFAELLEMKVVFDANYAFDNGLYGNATLTSLPILESENVALPNPDGAEPRGCLRVRVAKGGHTVDIFNTHLGLNPGERKEQAGAIVDMVREFPAVLAGDLNAEPKSPPLEILRAAFRDTYTNPSAAASTLPKSDRPRRIDYILITSQIMTVSSTIVAEGGTEVASDHYPYVARLSLGAPPKVLEDEGIYWNDDEGLKDALLHERE